MKTTTGPYRATPAYQLVQRAILATVIVAAPLLMASWFALCPQYGNPGCPDTSNPLDALLAYRAAPPVLLHAFLLINVVVPYVFSLGYLALGLVTVRQSPWLATLGMVCGWMGSAAWGLVTDRSFLLADLANAQADSVSVGLIAQMNQHVELILMAAAWVFGHLLAYILLGLAIARLPAVPPWSSWVMVAAAPLMGPIAYGTNQGYLQVLGFLLVFVASVPAAAATLRGSGSVRPATA